MVPDFWKWLQLLVEARQDSVPASVLQAYERAFRQELERLIDRTQDPTLKQKFLEMIDCPLIDSRDQCRGFAEYIVSALIRNGVHLQNDLEAALAYVVEKMLMTRTDAGGPRVTVFGGFEERPGYVQGNPLQGRFLRYLEFAVRNLKKGKIPRVSTVERRPQGSVSIAQARQKEGEPGQGISQDEISDRPSTEADFGQLVEDITTLLRRRERLVGLALVDQFQAMLSGQNVEQQRRQFGDRRARLARQVILQTVEAYARETENHGLLQLLRRMQAKEKARPRDRARKPAKPKLSDKQRDYASILSVLDRLGRPAGTADLGRYRRRWLQYPPREPMPGYRNRLEEVLDKMVMDGVLRAIRTKSGAYLYEPGPHADEYRQLEWAN